MSGYDDSPIDVTFGGDVINHIDAGTIKFENVHNFTASVMQNSGESIDVSTTGNLFLTKTGATALQNKAGVMNLFVGGNINVAGVIENSNSASPVYDDSGNLRQKFSKIHFSLDIQSFLYMRNLLSDQIIYEYIKQH